MIPFQRELQDNRRLRLGLMAVVAIVWVLALLQLDDHLSAARQEEGQLRGQIIRLQAMGKEDRWPGYRDRVTKNLAQFRARAWREESEGRIQAHLQDWLREQLAEGGIKADELLVSLPQGYETPAEGTEESMTGIEKTRSEDDLPPEMRVVHARLTFAFHEQPFLKLMNAISGSAHWLWIERLTVRNWGKRTVELELGALFVIGPRQEGE